MYAEFGVNKWPLEEFIKKYFEMTDDVMTSDYNITYTINRCMGVSKEVKEKVKQDWFLPFCLPALLPSFLPAFPPPPRRDETKKAKNKK